MVRKIFLAFLVTSILVSSICSAKISSDRIYLGGLTFGSNISEAKKIYGKPSRSSVEAGLVHHFYGDGTFMISEGRGGAIDTVFTRANNGIKTADGITVGMSKQKMLDTYGKEDFSYQHNGQTYYGYYKSDVKYDGVVLQFSVVNDKIVAISVHNEI